jgi:toxin secretion/phage lysis holin
MEKYFNTASVLFGLAGGLITGVLGGWDVLTHAIVVLVLVDYMTGIGKAFVNKEVSSAIGFKGIFKKILIFVVIAVSVEMQKIIGDGIPLREIVIMFYIANEGISLLENVSEFIPMPQKMKDIFIQIRDKEGEKWKNSKNSSSSCNYCRAF